MSAYRRRLTQEPATQGRRGRRALGQRAPSRVERGKAQETREQVRSGRNHVFLNIVRG